MSGQRGWFARTKIALKSTEVLMECSSIIVHHTLRMAAGTGPIVSCVCFWWNSRLVGTLIAYVGQGNSGLESVGVLDRTRGCGSWRKSSARNSDGLALSAGWPLDPPTADAH